MVLALVSFLQNWHKSFEVLCYFYGDDLHCDCDGGHGGPGGDNGRDDG